MDENPRAPLPSFDCSDFLFRAVAYPELVRKSDGAHKWQTFARREQQDSEGLSVMTSIELCKHNPAFEKPIAGVRSIHVGWLRDHGFDAFRTSLDHANIRFLGGENLPLRSGDQVAAQNSANDLLSLSRPVAYWAEENADDRFRAELQATRAARNHANAR